MLTARTNWDDIRDAAERIQRASTIGDLWTAVAYMVRALERTGLPVPSGLPIIIKKTDSGGSKQRRSRKGVA